MKQHILFEVDNQQTIEQTKWAVLTEKLEEIFKHDLMGYGVKILKIERLDE